MNSIRHTINSAPAWSTLVRGFLAQQTRTVSLHFRLTPEICGCRRMMELEFFPAEADSTDARRNYMSMPVSLNSSSATSVSPAQTAQRTQNASPATNGRSESSSGVSSSTASASAPLAYTVHISSAAQLATQEVTETSVQTAQEAARGDLQATHLLAREAAARKA